MLLLLALILHWAIKMYGDIYAVILHVDNICDFLRMVLACDISLGLYLYLYIVNLILSTLLFIF